MASFPPLPTKYRGSGIGEHEVSHQFVAALAHAENIAKPARFFLGLSKTCAKLGFAFWDYLGSRLAVPNQPEVPYLPAIVRHRCATA